MASKIKAYLTIAVKDKVTHAWSVVKETIEEDMERLLMFSMELYLSTRCDYDKYEDFVVLESVILNIKQED